jgi:hypothetical protein
LPAERPILPSSNQKYRTATGTPKRADKFTICSFLDKLCKSADDYCKSFCALQYFLPFGLSAASKASVCRDARQAVRLVFQMVIISPYAMRHALGATSITAAGRAGLFEGATDD